MRTHRSTPLHLTLSALGLALLGLAVTGCGDSPTAPTTQAPPAATAPEWYDITIRFVSVKAIEDGDGIEGDGDFVFQMAAECGTDRFEYHTSTTSLVSLGDGESLTLNRSKTFRIRADDRRPIEFVVMATEWDQNILGQVYPDSDLDAAMKRVVLPDDARKYNLGLYRPLLGNSACQVEYSVMVTSAPVVE